MKCALELLAIKQVAIENWEKEEKMRDMEALLVHEEIVTKTIDFCDTVINDALVEQAEKRCRNILYRIGKIKIKTDRLGNEHFSLVKRGERLYANGDYSYIICDEEYDYNTLKDYLSAHCLKLNKLESSYCVYGWGSFDCFDITVEVPKEG